jgi:N-methylhydantoinase B
LRGEAKASFLMDHGRVGPPGLLGGSPGAVNEITVSQSDVVSTPPHLSKGEGYVLAPGDWIAVKTPGGGGYGLASERAPAMVERDIARGYYTDVEADRLFTRTRAAAAE